MSSEPTKKQKEYAYDIARILDIPVPQEDTRAAFGTFIALNCEEYHQMREKKKKEQYVAQEVEARIRLQNVKQRLSEQPLTTPDAIVQFMQKQMKNASVETIYVVNLDTKFRVINFSKVAAGTINACITSGREVYKTAILSNAAFILLFHNHVSGDVSPSKEDEALTKTLIQSGTLLGIPLLDHIITGLDGHYSFAERTSLFKSEETTGFSYTHERN